MAGPGRTPARRILLDTRVFNSRSDAVRTASSGLSLYVQHHVFQGPSAYAHKGPARCYGRHGPPPPRTSPTCWTPKLASPFNCSVPPNCCRTPTRSHHRTQPTGVQRLGVRHPDLYLKFAKYVLLRVIPVETLLELSHLIVRYLSNVLQREPPAPSQQTPSAVSVPALYPFSSEMFRTLQFLAKKITEASSASATQHPAPPPSVSQHQTFELSAGPPHLRHERPLLKLQRSPTRVCFRLPNQSLNRSNLTQA